MLGKAPKTWAAIRKQLPLPTCEPGSRAARPASSWSSRIELSLFPSRRGNHTYGNSTGTGNFPRNFPKYTFAHFSGTNSLASASCPRARANMGKNVMARKDYLTRQATTLIKFAQATTDPQVVAGLV